MNTINSTDRSDNLFILYCLCLPLLWVKDEETSVWLSILYIPCMQVKLFSNATFHISDWVVMCISVRDLKMIIYTSKTACVNGFLVLNAAHFNQKQNRK